MEDIDLRRWAQTSGSWHRPQTKGTAFCMSSPRGQWGRSSWEGTVSAVLWEGLCVLCHQVSCSHVGCAGLLASLVTQDSRIHMRQKGGDLQLLPMPTLHPALGLLLQSEGQVLHLSWSHGGDKATGTTSRAIFPSAFRTAVEVAVTPNADAPGTPMSQSRENACTCEEAKKTHQGPGLQPT
ncbi:hypothetical protein QTO34_016440 [Cnephaeus nilssonii]|uniref:Uncharacterized protein n=1 Tax=Cnephaeus nilssonii TaxID=3371016 RepID=A0AA40I284_CNENI|nr:hypothetical protein QTO34_016440 [Eptesicus nilssonii]